MKKAVLAGLFLITLTFLGIGILFYRQNWEWLNTRRLDNLSVILLAGFGLATVLTPLILRNRPIDITEADLAKTFLRVFAQVFGVTAGVFTLLFVFGLVMEAFTRYPLLVLIILLLLLPLLLIAIDMFKGKIKKSPRSLMVGYSYYSFGALYLLIAQLLLLPLLFFLGPMGIALFLISLVDAVARVVPSLEAAPIPILCYWTGIEQPVCTPALISLLLLYLLLLFGAVRFGDRIMDAIAGGFHKGKEKLNNAMQYEDAS